METSPLICSANQWTGFYMITASVREELIGDRSKDARFQSQNTFVIFLIWYFIIF